MKNAGLNDASGALPGVSHAVVARYLAALLVLAVITAISFVVVRTLIGDMRRSEVLIAEAADLRSSIHKTMLALDQVDAGRREAAPLARTEAEALGAGMDRLLALLEAADAGPEAWRLVRSMHGGLERNVRLLIEKGLAAGTADLGSTGMNHTTGPAAHAPVAHTKHPTLKGNATPAHGKSATAETRQMQGHGADGHNSPAMIAVDELIEHLRADARAEQDWAGNFHDLLGAGILLVLVVEAVIIFRPLLKKAEYEANRADRAVSELEFLASHDALTGLLNRGQIDRVLHIAVEEAAASNSLLGLILLDLDEFKPINDTLGHAAGDAILAAVGNRIRATISPTAIAGRLGGDEFIVMLPKVDLETEVKAVAEQLLGSLAAPVHFNGQDIRPKASIGFAVFPVAGSDVPSLLAAADLAMYSAKRTGRGRVSEFSDRMRAESERARAMKRSISDAFSSRQFVVHFQAIHHVADASVGAVEALVRWNHPQRGLLLPDEFLDDLRLAGQSNALVSLVISEALAQFARWHAGGFSLEAVHVNADGEFLRDPEAVSMVRKELKAHRLPARCLVLDITDGVLQQDSKVHSALAAFHNMGVGLALGNFGAGGASLLALRHHEIGIIKLGRAFTADALHSGEMATITSLAAFLRSMGKTVCAEGVETPEAATLLGAAGVELLQGYYFNEPDTAARLAEQLARNSQRVCAARPMF